MYLNMFEAKNTKLRKMMCHSLPDSCTEWYLTIQLCFSFEKGMSPPVKVQRHITPKKNARDIEFFVICTTTHQVLTTDSFMKFSVVSREFHLQKCNRKTGRTKTLFPHQSTLPDIQCNCPSRVGCLAPPLFMGKFVILMCKIDKKWQMS